MKVAILFVALFGLLAVSQAKPTREDPTLDHYLNELAAYLPQQELQNWLINLVTNDPDFAKLVEYIKSDHYKIIDEHIHANQYYYDFLLYIESENIPIIEYLNTLRGFLGLPEIQPPSKTNKINHKELPDVDFELLHIVVEFYEILEPYGEQIGEYIQSIKDEPAIVELVTRVKSDENKEFLLEYLGGHKEFQELLQILEDPGKLPIKEIVKALKELLGWN